MKNNKKSLQILRLFPKASHVERRSEPSFSPCGNAALLGDVMSPHQDSESNFAISLSFKKKICHFLLSLFGKKVADASLSRLARLSLPSSVVQFHQPPQIWPESHTLIRHLQHHTYKRIQHIFKKKPLNIKIN